MSISPGTRFGSYEVLEPIGSGGMGEVFRARDTELKRNVAVKVLPQAFVDDPDRLSRFRREAEILASLNHSNIAQVFGLETVDDQMVIVMELVEGPTLADRLQDGPIPPDEALAIARQVADALEAAHANQIVHRDLKPANIKLREDSTVKVLDFGISKPIDPKAISGASPVHTTPAVTETGIIIGTAAYMSPEQARGKFVDQRTDIWAFGCLLFEMLTGQSAFGSEDVMLTLARVLDRDTDLSSIPKSISPAVRHTLKLCLEKDPRKRISDIRDVRLALEGRFESELPQLAERVAPVSFWRRLLPIAAAAIVAAVLAMLAVRYFAEPEAATVRRSVHVLSPGQNWHFPFVPATAISPDGNTIVFAVDQALYRRSLDELEARVIPGTESEIPIVPTFSPDGQHLLYGSNADGQLKRVAVEGGTPQMVLPEYQGGGWDWTDAETIHYSANFEDQCRIFELAATGGEPALIAEVTGFNCYEPSLLPGGEYLLYWQRRPTDVANVEVVVQSLATGEVIPLFPGRQPIYLEPYLIYFDATLGLMARAFDPEDLTYGNSVPLVENILLVNQVSSAQLRVGDNGDLIYIEGETAAVEMGIPLSVVDRNGSIRRLNVPLDNYRFPALSRNGDRVAVQINRETGSQIFIYDLEGDGGINQLTFEGSNTRPTWSPDGDWVIFSSDRGDGTIRLWRKLSNLRGEAERLTDPEEGHMHDTAAFTADGERLAFSDTIRGDDATEDIWIMDYPDGEPEILLGGEGTQTHIAFSPDGTAMAYHLITQGSSRVFVAPYPKEPGIGFRISEEGVDAGWPVWSKDSQRIYYAEFGSGEFVSVDVDASSSAWSNRRKLGLGGNPGQRRLETMPSGDDELLISIAVQATDGPSTIGRRIVIVENWIEEIKRRVPEPR